MSLDVGALFGTVSLETTLFDRAYARVVGQMRSLGAEADKASTGTTTLERGLTGAAGSANEASAAMGRAQKATVDQAAADTKAAAAAKAHADAMVRITAITNPAVATTERLQAAQLRQIAAQERVDELQATGSATARQLASANATLISSSRSVAAAQAEAAASSSKWRTALAGGIRTAGELGVVFGGFELVKQALDIAKEASNFQRDMLLIQTQAGASASEIKTLSAAVLDMAGSVATSPEELATSLYHVYSVGLRGAQALNVVRIAAEGAKIGNADLEQTTNALTSSVASGISGVKNMAQAMGALTTIVGVGDMKLSDLNDALGGGILSIARTYNVSLAQVGAALAVFGDNNIRGADAATKLRMSIMDLAKPAAGADKVLSQVGLSAKDLRDALEKGGLTSALDLLSSHMTAAGITAGKVGPFIVEAFTKRAGAGLSVLIEQMQRFHLKLSDITAGAGSFADRWTATTKTASFEFKSLEVAAETAGIKIAEKAVPVLAQVASDIGTALPKALHAASGALGPFEAAWGVTAGALKIAGTGIKDIAGFLDAIGPELKIVGTLAAAMWLGFKGGTLAVAAVRGLQSLFDTLALKAMYAQDAITGAWARIGGAATTAAEETGAATTTIAAESDAAATAVNAAGDSAKIGWAGLAGPIGLAAAGVLTLISLFHSSSAASQEATNAAKAYSDALSGKDGSGQGTILDAITQQLKDNSVPQRIDTLNKIMGRTVITGQQFALAIQSGGKPLDNLKTKLTEAAKSQGFLSTGFKAANQLYADAVAQYNALSSATKKDLVDTKSFAGVSSAIQQTTASTEVGSQTAQQYATMMGIVVDKNGVAAVSAKVLNAAVNTVADAYNSATATGNDFLTALDTFSKSAGTAADRAALIGATLKAANGDALAFAGAMASAYDAARTFSSDVAQSSGAEKAATDAAAKAKKEHASAATQAADASKAATAANLKYLKSIVDLKTGTIDYTKAGAGPLITDLQGIQTAAENAAEATYQHEIATKGATKAADDAYTVYVSQTRNQLIDQAEKLGLNYQQAKKFADQYFNIADAKNIKKTIEMAGANPVVNVLNRIGQQLSYLTGHPWTPRVSVDTSEATSALAALQNQLRAMAGSHQSWGVSINNLRRALGGPIDGPGAKGVDSVPLLAAPGEWVINDMAVDRLKRQFGPNVMAIINSGQLPMPKLPVATQPAVIAAHTASTPTRSAPANLNVTVPVQLLLPSGETLAATVVQSRTFTGVVDELHDAIHYGY